MTHQNLIASKYLQPGVFGVSCPIVYVALMALSLVLFSLAGTGTAQQPIRITDDSRDLAYNDLAKEAEAMLRQHSLLKKIVKASGPGIAHIEAKKRPKQPANSKRRPVVIEEAGSGVVIQYRGKFYVITNFHVIEDAAAADIQIEIGGKLFFPKRLVHDRETLSLIHI